MPPNLTLRASFWRSLSASLLPILGLTSQAAAAQREALVTDWQFHRGPLPAADAAWETVVIPHDWSIAEAPVADAPSDGGGGFFPTGEGWYRLSLDGLDRRTEKRIVLHFEGVYRNAEVWVNGSQLATHAYGYSPFRVELNDALSPGEANEVLVRVVNEPQPNSRWYSGSGIYRPVWLEIYDSIHLEPDSLHVWTRSIGPTSAELSIDATVLNTTEYATEATLQLTGLAPDGATVFSKEVPVKLKPEDDAGIATQVTVNDPALWSPDSPALHTLKAELFVDGQMTDTVETAFGIRSLRWSATEGFLLNGESVLLRGGNVHHDHGPLGTAAFPDAEERKVRILLDAGYNAVRTAHNPPSTAFLEACDRLGMLVFDESFDSWKSKKLPHDYGEIFDDNWESDLRAFVRRDRNHPSVIAWSLGNEVYERGNAKGAARAHAMAALVRSLDRSRPVTVGLNGLGTTGDWTKLDALFDGLDLAGYNYELALQHVGDHERRPNRVVYASESYQRDAFENWMLMQAHPYIIGDFVWSAIDYLGEAGIGRVFPSDEEARAHWEGTHFPWFGAYCGDISVTGRRKPISIYRELVWGEGPTLHASVAVPSPDGKPWNLTLWSIAPVLESWTWPGFEGQLLQLEVASRHPRVRVALNGRQIGEQASGIGTAYRNIFNVPYEAGTVLVEGLDERGTVLESYTLETTGEAAALRLEATESMEAADPLDLAFVDLTVVDAEGHWRPDAAVPVTYAVDGPAELIAVGTSDIMQAAEPYPTPQRTTFEGRSLIVLRSTGEAGTVTLTARSPGFPTTSLTLDVPAR